ncbi:MAG TPA: D-tyrosyl-tRNA(Tyr) deacylase [Candidatus Magasanikbacteria bacterium]|nr:D-tyrosyl-tRNA(Tyr) deacylase [Candidatus Magasanikbacteria bacterium]
MRVVLQRVKSSNVRVNNETVGEISHGFLILLGVGKSDEGKDADWLVEKIIKLRVFEDENGKINKDIVEVGGEILVVSQFTLYGDCQSGNRPGFTEAASPEEANKLYEYFVAKLKEKNIKIQTGQFGACMEVGLVNDGPVTLIIESK